MQMSSEMQKLRDWLDKNEIIWGDNSYVMSEEETLVSAVTGYKFDLTIYRTQFNYKGKRFSVVQGQCTYGGSDGFLKLWNKSDWGEPAGWYTASDVIAELKKI